jgi:Phage protein Gp138 N-terminal domain
MSEIDDLIVAIQGHAKDNGTEINTSIPGKIISYDAKTNRATVQPSIPRINADGTWIPSPKIVQVPVMFPASGMGGKQAGIHLPIGPGDGVKLDFTHRSIENWLSGNNDAPDDPRQFDLSDCIATPGLNSSGFSGDPSNLVIRMDRSSLTLKPDNTIVFGNENGSITIMPDGKIILKGTSIEIDTPANSFVAETHRHIDVQSGLGESGKPI